MKNVKKWKEPSLLGFSSKFAAKPDLTMYYDVDDLTSPVNALANKIAAATPSYKHKEATAPNGAGGYRGNIIIVSSPTMSEVEISNGFLHDLNNSHDAFIDAQFDTTFTVSQLQKELMFFTTDVCIMKGDYQDTMEGRVFGALPPDLISLLSECD